MAEVIILEFDGDAALYNKVNDLLGLNPDTGTGEWPKGIVSHVGAATATGIVVMEVWESQADQEAFMASRLGPALAKAEAPQPKRVEWMSLLGQQYAS